MYFFDMDLLVLSVITFVVAAITSFISYFSEQILEINLEDASEKLLKESNVTLLCIRKHSIEKMGDFCKSLTTVYRVSLQATVYAGIVVGCLYALSHAAFFTAHWQLTVLLSGSFVFIALYTLKLIKARRKARKTKAIEEYATKIVDEIQTHAPVTSAPQLNTAKPAVIQTNLQRKSQLINTADNPENSSEKHGVYNKSQDFFCGMTQTEFDRFVDETYH